MEHVQPREPESDPEDDEVRTARNAERKRKHEEEIEKIKRMKMEDLGDLDLPAGRSGLQTTEHMEQSHHEWQRADKAGDAAGRMMLTPSTT